MKWNAGKILCLVILAFSFSGHAARVYLMPTGNAPADGAALRALMDGGHTVFFGVQAFQWDGTQVDLNNDFDAVVILNSFNWTSLSMPRAGILALNKFVFNGGGLVTGEVFNWNVSSGSRHVELGAVMPVAVVTYSAAPSTTYSQVTPDPILNDGLPTSFTFNLQLIGNIRESSFNTRGPDAIVFYSSSTGGGRPGSPGIVGWNVFNGRVLSFSTNITDVELGSGDYKRLFVNAVNWVARQADIAVTKTASADTVPAGSNITYTIAFSNNGPSPALPVTLTDTLPDQTTFQSLTAPTGWSCDTPNVGGTGTITCTISSWNIYWTSTLSLVVQVNADAPEGTIINNTATVSSPASDPIPDNNTATATVTVSAASP